jgi:histidinol-phosphatase (PHP family)
LNKLFDYHVHTTFSADSQMQMEEACQRALESGLKEIAFTDHIDCFYPKCDLRWEFDYTQYAQSIERMRQQFGPKLQVLKGIEVGLHPLAFEPSREFTSQNEFDFIIGSVHIVGSQDMHTGEYFVGKSREEAITTYFQTVNTCVKNYQDFNVLGHLDLIKRYLFHIKCSVDDVNWKKYDECILDTLRHLVETGRGIEINMSGYNSGLNCSLPDLRILQLYREVRGEIITIGSDAHTVERIGDRVALGLDMLESAGFKYITTFRNRKPKFIPLTELR